MNRPASLHVVICLLAVACGSLAASGEAPREIITVRGDAKDVSVDRNGTADGVSAPALRVGTAGDDLRGQAALYFFALPTLSPRDAVAGAELELQYLGTAKGTGRNFGTPAFALDLFGLDARADATVTAADYHDGTSLPQSGSLVARSLVTPTTKPGPVRVSDPPLRDFVASLYHADGTPKAKYAAFRVNADTPLPVSKSQYQGYELATADNAEMKGEYAPVLKLTVAPKPAAAGIPTNAEQTPAPEPTGLRTAVWILGALLALCLVVIALLLLRRPRTEVPNDGIATSPASDR